jgi:uncharacterized protein
VTSAGEAVVGDDPVTVAVSFKVKAGHEADFESWAHDITTAAADFPGFLGASWIRSGSTFQVVYRFADHTLFHAWHESKERASFLKQLGTVANLVTDEHLTGLETWFQLPEQPGRPAPPRWKMAITTWVGVFPLLAILQWLIGPQIVSWPLVARVMLLTLIIVGLMTYVVMPRLARFLQRWLYPAS